MLLHRLGCGEGTSHLHCRRWPCATTATRRAFGEVQVLEYTLQAVICHLRRTAINAGKATLVMAQWTQHLRHDTNTAQHIHDTCRTSL